MRNDTSKTPTTEAIIEKINDVPAKTKPTGYPVKSRLKVDIINKIRSECSVMTLV